MRRRVAVCTRVRARVHIGRCAHKLPAQELTRTNFFVLMQKQPQAQRQPMQRHPTRQSPPRTCAQVRRRLPLLSTDLQAAYALQRIPEPTPLLTRGAQRVMYAAGVPHGL